MRIKKLLLEDYYSYFSPESKEEIDSIPNLRSLVRNNEVNSDIIKIADPIEDSKALVKMAELSKDAEQRQQIYLKLFQSRDVEGYGDGSLVKLDNNLKQLISLSMVEKSHSDVESGNAPLFEFVKKLLNKTGYVPPFNLISAIEEMLERRILDEYDLIDSSWLISKDIYKESSLDDQLYKIKLHHLLNSKNKDLDDYKDSKGNKLPDEYRNWSSMAKKSTKELKKIFSQYNNRDAQAKSKNLISLEKWIKDRIDDTKEEVNPRKKWDVSNISEKLSDIIKKSSLKDEIKKDLLDWLRELFYPANVKSLNYFYKEVNVKSNTLETDYNYLSNVILKYKNNNYNLASKSGGSIEQDKFKPGEVLTFEEILNRLGLTKSEAYGKLGSYTLKLDHKHGSEYTKALKKLFKNPKNSDILKDLYRAKIRINSKGNIPWTSFIRNYFDSVDLK